MKEITAKEAKVIQLEEDIKLVEDSYALYEELKENIPSDPDEALSQKEDCYLALFKATRKAKELGADQYSANDFKDLLGVPYIHLELPDFDEPSWFTS